MAAAKQQRPCLVNVFGGLEHHAFGNVCKLSSTPNVSKFAPHLVQLGKSCAP